MYDPFDEFCQRGQRYVTQNFKLIVVYRSFVEFTSIKPPLQFLHDILKACNCVFNTRSSVPKIHSVCFFFAKIGFCNPTTPPVKCC